MVILLKLFALDPANRLFADKNWTSGNIAVF